MGTVYVAHDPLLGRMVAVKVFASDLDVPDARERFSREARAAAALNHPNIVTVYDFGEYGAQPYIVMEYVPGDTIANVIRRKMPVSVADKLRWIEELCAGAGYAHQMSVIHRDIKPANLMIDRSGRLKILDFGIARMIGIASNTAVMIGTPGYMAPEQVTGGPIDHRSDQFSIGVVFYELLAYGEAFPGETLPAITHRILNEQPKPLLGAVADVTPEIGAIVDQALQKKMADRFRDTEAMRLAIARVRRHFESEETWQSPSMPSGRDITPLGANRGTGSSRRRQSGSVGVAQLTPPPDPRRTDREAIARRRAAQVEAALSDARQLFAAQQLEAALDACQQALTLDETHVGAIELTEEIEAALRLGESGAAPVDDPDRTIASEPASLNPGIAQSRLFESQAVTRIHDEGEGFAVGSPPPPTGPTSAAAPLRTSGAVERPLTTAPAIDTGVSDRTVRRPPPTVREPQKPMTAKQDPPSFAPVEATIIAPSRRTPPPVSPVPPVPQPEVTVMRPAAVPAALAATPQVKVPVSQPASLDLLARITAIPQAVVPAANQIVQALRGTTPGAMPRSTALTIVGAVTAFVILAIAAVSYFLTSSPVPTGILVIDAVPWATVTSIHGESGSAQALPAQASTPLSLSLPAGTYQIVLTGPPPESKVTTVTARVDVAGVAVVPITRFETGTVEGYFEQYLTSSGSASVPPAAAQPKAAPPAAVQPPSVPAPAPPSGGNP